MPSAVKSLIVVLLCVVLALVAWALLSDAGHRPGEVATDESDGDDAGLQGRAGTALDVPATNSVPVRVEQPAGPLVRYEGRVVGKDGKPVGGARVDVRGPDVVDDIRTDEDGRFVVTVHAGRYEVTARTPAGEAFRRQDVLVAEAAEEGAVLRTGEAHALRVRFTLGGRPLSDVRVTAYGGSDWRYDAEARGAHAAGEAASGPDGYATLDALATGVYELQMAFPFGATLRTSRRHRSHDEFLVDLPALSEITGRVTNGVDGPGIDGASVSFRCGGHGPVHGLRVVTTTDSAGAYVARVPAGWDAQYWYAEVSAAGFWEWRTHLVPADGTKDRGAITNYHGNPVHGYDIALVPRTRARGHGRVVASDGAGVGDVLVVVRRSGSTPRQPDMTRIRTTGDGSFSLDAVERGSYTAYVRDDDWLTSKAGVFRIGPAAAEPEAVLIEVERAGSLSGRVVDDQGRGVPGARVWVDRRRWRDSLPANGPWPGEVLTDAEGRFSVGGLAPRSGHFVEAVWRDRRSERVNWTPIARRSEDNVLRLEPAVTLHGSVRDVSGDGIAFARFFIYPAKWKRGSPNRGLVPYLVECDADGTFEIPALQPGVWHAARIRGSDDYQSLDWRGKSGLIEKTFWRDQIKIRGRVMDEDGNPVVAHASLRGTSNGREVKLRTQSTDDGCFEFVVLAKGTYGIGFTAPGYERTYVDELTGGEDDVTVTLTPER